jgi:DeoR/GlpR family transcriptional regulator of sugar metabolism/DNA-binding LacI/PurR family transcriptional regulator
MLRSGEHEDLISLIKSAREQRILELLAARSPRSIGDLCSEIGTVSPISVRRDLARLAARGVLVRTHGGAARAKQLAETEGAVDATIQGVDAIVLPPVHGRVADTLRLMARRRGIPFLAESSQQAGGIYLGPDNFAAGRDLGAVAGRLVAQTVSDAQILLVALDELPNTRARCDGFLAGLEAEFPGSVEYWRVEGHGSFRDSLQASLDLLETQPGINVAFGVNDHAILAALEAAERVGVDISGFSVGGEGNLLFEALARGERLKACAALFPEIVGMRAVETLASAFAGTPLPEEIRTPHVVLTPDSLSSFYRQTEAGFTLTPDGPARLGCSFQIAKRSRQTAKRSIGFMPHYPAHDWYRIMARAMRTRAADFGLELRVSAPTSEVAREIADLRRLIARAACRQIRPGETVLINAGPIALATADAVAERQGLTVVTNSFDVLHRLSGRADLKVILTGGEYQAKDRCLVGPSLGALFESLRVDRALLSVDGVSAQFGASMVDERLALATRRGADASREVMILADHSLVGVEASHRIAPPRALTALVTDSGTLPAARLACAAAGWRVLLADQEELPDDVPKPAQAAQRPPARR